MFISPQSLTHRLQSSSNLPCLNLYLFLSYNFQLCSTLCHQPFLFQTYKSALANTAWLKCPLKACSASLVFSSFLKPVRLMRVYSFWMLYVASLSLGDTMLHALVFQLCLSIIFCCLFLTTCRVTYHPILPELSHV